MIDILRFIMGNGFWNFLGCVVLIYVVFEGIASIFWGRSRS